MVETDWAIGKIMKALDDSKQAANTVIIFTCDNGTSPIAQFAQLAAKNVFLNENWRGHKADAYEGGHRVPFIVRWPGKVVANTRSDETITIADIMATCAEILGTALPETAAEDSVSMIPVLRGAADAPLHEFIISHSGSGHFALRMGPWKLLLCRGSGGWSEPSEKVALKQELPALQLFNLDDDPKETKNLQATHPEKVKTLVDALARAIRDGRTTPGPRQANQGWPNTISRSLLARFPQLAKK